ncbi:MAG: tRNA uridine-5-carboxymethylaminomethyl(34) synthesis GTPase MnmE, partial [Oscillospiraceae bacterium]|nr:tRNA uridine-5-carboxymethylaminomethyl(34) synthesis GTPase MnmE [Oscillospiraceae bacterium]
MSDVIAAISTAAAVSAIGIVRMSGDGAIEIASGVFRPYFGGPLEKAPDRKLILGDIIGENGMPLDSCLATVSRGPGSYTGEDTAEFQCHGSPVVLAELLRLL